MGLKLHEDWGTTPAAIDCCLEVAERLDVQVAIHTDTLNESGLRGAHPGRLQGPHHPRLPHRRRGRRPRPGHHQGLRRAPRAAFLHQPHPALHGEHHRRASGHAHGLPPPGRLHPRGRGLRRIAHPPRDHRRRGHPARPGRHEHDLLGLSGHGPGGRGHHPHLADRPQDEDPARPPAGATRAATTAGPSATWPSTPSTRPSPTASPTRWARSSRASSRTSCSGSRPSSGSSPK